MRLASKLRKQGESDGRKSDAAPSGARALRSYGEGGLHGGVSEARSRLKPLIAGAEGFIRAGRFQSLSNPRTLLGITEWKDEASVQAWRNVLEHRLAQKAGRESFFEDYTITVASSLRRYTMGDRDEAPEDSNRFHGAGLEAA